MEPCRDYLDRFYRCTSQIDGLYYLAARRLGVNENALALLYTLDDGRPRSQKQLSEELVVPKTTVNTEVRECVRAGYVQLTPTARGKEKEVALTDRGRAYTRQILAPIYAAEERAMEETLREFSPQFIQAAEAFSRHLQEAFRPLLSL